MLLETFLLLTAAGIVFSALAELQPAQYWHVAAIMFYLSAGFGCVNLGLIGVDADDGTAVVTTYAGDYYVLFILLGLATFEIFRIYYRTNEEVEMY